jgi:site-specific DNA recombinase
VDLKAKRVAVYARYSSDRQSPSSIEDQLRVCREYVERAGGQLGDALLFTDAAFSGTFSARPGFIALQQALRNHEVDVVVTEDISRIGRDVGNNDRAIKELKELGARLIAINDGFDTGQEDAMFLGTIKSAMGELYIKQLAQRTKRGLDGAFDAGMHTGGRVFGYRIVAANDGTVRKRLEVEPDEASLVRRIFDDWNAGLTLRGIAHKLNGEGVKSPRGRLWAMTSVRAILRNEIYNGVAIFNRRKWKRDNQTGKRRHDNYDRAQWRKRERPELRVVDVETWQAAQEKMRHTTRDQKAGKRTRAEFPFSGRLVCGECGELMVIGGSTERRYYQCGGQRRALGCNNRSGLREDALRRWVFSELLTVISERAMIDELRAHYASTLGGRDREIKGELGRLRSDLATVVAQADRLVDFLLEPGGESSSIRAKIAEKERLADALRGAIAQRESDLTRVPVIPSGAEIRAFFAALPAVALSEAAEVRAVLAEVIPEPAKCCPVAEGYRVEFDLSLDAILSTTSAAPSARRPRWIVSVAGAGFAHDPAPNLRRIAGFLPRLGGRP